MPFDVLPSVVFLPASLFLVVVDDEVLVVVVVVVVVVVLFLADDEEDDDDSSPAHELIAMQRHKPITDIHNVLILLLFIIAYLLIRFTTFGLAILAMSELAHSKALLRNSPL